MSTHRRTSHPALLAGQVSLWPVDAPEPVETLALVLLPAPDAGQIPLRRDVGGRLPLCAKCLCRWDRRSNECCRHGWRPLVPSTMPAWEKHASAGGQVYTIPTRSTKLSQTCQCGQVKKKPLSLRVHACPACGLQMQRDLYSAYLIRFVDLDTYLLHADQAVQAWPGWEPILRAAWQQAHPTSQPASGRARRSPHVRRRKAAARQSRSSAAGAPAQPKSLDAVTVRP